MITNFCRTLKELALKVKTFTDLPTEAAALPRGSNPERGVYYRKLFT